MTNSSEKGEWELRAGQLKQAGAQSATAAEIAAVHAGLFPNAEPICVTCPGKYGPAYFRIIRYLNQLEQASTTSSISTTSMSQSSQARFLSDDTQYFPHGLGVAVNNDNLTDKMARYILEKDPDAKGLFKTLPGKEVAAPKTPPVPAAPKTPAKPAPVAKLATTPQDVAPGALTAAPTMAVVPPAEGEDEGEGDKGAEPVQLTENMLRPELEAIYADEVKEGDPEAFANKGELIAAIEKHRADQAAQ